MIWYVTSYGDRQAATRLEGIGDSARNPRPAFEEIYLTILDIEDEMFDREGARGQVKWAQITLMQMQYKKRHGLSPQILHAYGDLRRSLTVYRHPDQNIRIERTKIVFGTKLEKGKWLYKGWKQPSSPYRSRTGRRTVATAKVPGRKFIHFTHQDANAFGREIMRYLLRPSGPGTMRAGIL